MKILFAYIRTLSQGPSYEEVHIKPTLMRLGHEVKAFNIADPNVNSSEDGIRPIDVEFLRAIDLYKPDLVISLLYKNTLKPETFGYLTDSSKITTMILSGDDEKNFKSVSSRYSPFVNCVMTTFKPAVEWHKKLCPQVIFAPYHANERMFKPLHKKRFIQASYCGGRNDYRTDVLNKIAMSGIKLKVYGNGWHDNSQLENTIEFVLLINITKVNISLSTDLVDGKEIIQVKARDFEVPMAGGFNLTRYNDELKPLYKFGKEIETYKSIDELIDKTKYYITHDSQREKIALAGHKRARRDHTSICRWRAILKQLKLKP